METNYKDSIRYKSAQKRMRDIKGFYTHLAVYLLVNTAIFMVSTMNQGFLEALTRWNNYTTFFFWGIGLFAHWASVFGPNLMFGRDWEEKKIREIMEKDNKQLWK